MRRGFTLAEVLVSLAIMGVLMTGLFAAIQMSVDSYARTSADGVNRLTARLLVERMALLIRTGTSFSPVPEEVTTNLIESDTLGITTASGQEVMITWNSDDETIEMDVDGVSSTVLGGVVQLADSEVLTPFLLQYENGTILRRVTINLAVVPDPEHATAMDGGGQTIRFTASVMPRIKLY